MSFLGCEVSRESFGSCRALYVVSNLGHLNQVIDDLFIVADHTLNVSFVLLSHDLRWNDFDIASLLSTSAHRGPVQLSSLSIQ